MKVAHSFEHKSKKLLPVKSFFLRQFVFLLYAFAVIAFSLFIGMAGYHYWGKLNWIDSLLNASMILTGMGPVNIMQSDAAKLFASFYSLYSGVVFLTTIAMILAPIVHRIMHILHIENYED